MGNPEIQKNYFSFPDIINIVTKKGHMLIDKHDNVEFPVQDIGWFCFLEEPLPDLES